MKLLASLKISVPHAHLIAARAARENEVVSCGDKRATGCATLNNDTEDATSSKTANQIDGSSPPQVTWLDHRYSTCVISQIVSDAVNNHRISLE